MAEPSVLIIDDDVWMQRILSKTLQSYGFKKSYLASNGFDGVAMAVELNPTLIILDIIMPELTGHLTLKILKHIKLTQNIPVLMVSAMSDAENLGKAFKRGTAGFISKPFTRATVYEKLIKIFGKEKLDLIAKGEDDFSELDIQEDEAPDENLEFELSEIRRRAANRVDKEGADEEKPDEEKTEKKSDKLLKHYQEDEKKSIESIKKLLLKNRK